MTVEEVKKELGRYQKLLSTLDEKEQEFESVKASVAKPIKAAITRNGGVTGGTGNPVYELVKNWEAVKSSYVKELNDIVARLLKIKYMLSVLPVDCDERRALEYKYIQDMSDVQVARQLNVSKRTAYRLYQSGYELIAQNYMNV